MKSESIFTSLFTSYPKYQLIMKILFTFIFSVVMLDSITGQVTNPMLDTTLSKKLGADEYGMKMYVLAILKTGDNKPTNKTFIDSCFTGHMANITRLAESNQLTIAGPFGKNESDFRGLFILNVSTIEKARELLKTDPAIKENLLNAELYPWYGSAALPEYLESHNKIWKVKP
jgi:uncharacterized protein